MCYSLLQKTSPSPLIFEKASEKEKKENDFRRIRCPHCRWQPIKSSRWWCADCDHPEYFYDACGSLFNTFETGGVCPVCRHRWRWTSCLQCHGWALHEDWYAKDRE